MKYTYWLFILFLLSACSESMNEDVDLLLEGEDFIPLALGQEMIFDLDSIIYDPEPGKIVVDTISYEMKYTVVDSFLDSEGVTNYEINRFLRKSDTVDWAIRDVWTAKLSDRQFIWVEENLPYIKLTFPMTGTERWDGNALFNDDDTKVKVRGELLDMFKFWGQYSAEGITTTEEVGGVSYNDVLTVDQVDREISIEKRFSQEKYARGIGLVYQRIAILDTQNENVAIPFETRAQRGFIVEIRRK